MAHSSSLRIPHRQKSGRRFQRLRRPDSKLCRGKSSHDRKATQFNHSFPTQNFKHCSIAAVSLCTLRHVRAYFRDGTMPPNGTTCDVQSILFSSSININSDGVYRTGDAETNAYDGATALTAEDRKLIRAGAILKEANLIHRLR